MKDKVVNAYKKLLANDRHLLIVGANERSITHKLAEYLQVEFPNDHVDCEYNRNGDIPKRLHLEIKQIRSDDAEGTTVYPDIIVHHRGSNDNLIVIEAKKGDQEGRDIEKLKAYKTELGYQFAFFVQFPAGDDAREVSYEKLQELVTEIL